MFNRGGSTSDPKKATHSVPNEGRDDDTRRLAHELIDDLYDRLESLRSVSDEIGELRQNMHELNDRIVELVGANQRLRRDRQDRRTSAHDAFDSTIKSFEQLRTQNVPTLVDTLLPDVLPSDERRLSHLKLTRVIFLELFGPDFPTPHRLYEALETEGGSLVAEEQLEKIGQLIGIAGTIREEANREADRLGLLYNWDFDFVRETIHRDRQMVPPGCVDSPPVTFVVIPGLVVDGTSFQPQVIFTRFAR